AVPAGTETGIATDGEGADVANFAAVAGFLVVIEAAVGGVVLANLDWIQRLELALVTHFIVSIFVEQGARIKRRTFSWRVIEVQCDTSPLTIKVVVTQLKVIIHEIVAGVLVLLPAKTRFIVVGDDVLRRIGETQHKAGALVQL